MPFLVFLLQFAVLGRAATAVSIARTLGWVGVRPPVPRGDPSRLAGDAGMSTAEYAVGTIAAVAFAGVLYAVISSPATREIISSVVERALSVPF